MQRSATFILVIACTLAATACSILTSFDDVRLGAIGADAAAIDSGAVDGGADATPSEAGSVDAGSDACTPGHVVCVDTSPATGGAPGPALYACNDAGNYDPPVSCLHMCVHTATGIEYCSCTAGDTYCGDDNVVGDPGSLYACEPAGPPSLKERCSISCVVHPGSNDQCNL